MLKKPDDVDWTKAYESLTNAYLTDLDLMAGNLEDGIRELDKEFARMGVLQRRILTEVRGLLVVCLQGNMEMKKIYGHDSELQGHLDSIKDACLDDGKEG